MMYVLQHKATPTCSIEQAPSIQWKTINCDSIIPHYILHKVQRDELLYKPSQRTVCSEAKITENRAK